MKQLFLLASVIFINAYSQRSFEFISYKDECSLDINFIKNIYEVFHPDVFFETGTHLAITTAKAAGFFKEVHTVELYDELFYAARSGMARFSNVRVYHGKSPDVITQVAPSLQGTILFWLDAHYSGGGTALSSDNLEDPDAYTAIRGELRAIKELNLKNCIILIDDIREFGMSAGGVEYISRWAYPSIQEVKRSLLEINPHYTFALAGDVLFAYNPDLYHPKFSETVISCTKSRLYNGYNLSDNELIDAEKLIMHATAREKQFINYVCNVMMNYEGRLFWYDLMHGLAELGSGNYMQAKIAFEKVNKDLRNSSCTFFYDNGRVDEYLKECLSYCEG